MAARYAQFMFGALRFLPVLLVLGGMAQADPNAPLIFQMQPEQYHAYQNDSPPPLTLTLTLKNSTARPVPLKCLAVGGPVLRRFTEFQNGQAVHRDESLGELKPWGNAPVCREVGQIITVPAGVTYTYVRDMGVPKVGAQVHYRAGWNVSVRPGSGWLQHAYASALVVAQDRLIPTPNPEAYQQALNKSRAQWYTRSSPGVPGDQRLSFGLADELSRQAFLAEMGKRGLDPSKLEIEVAPPVRFSTPAGAPALVGVRAFPQGQGFRFRMQVRNTGKAALRVDLRTCEPLAVERVADGLRLWQVGNGPCPAMAAAPIFLPPGQSTSREARWDGRNSLGQRVPSGQYRVKMGLGQFVGETVFTVK